MMAGRYGKHEVRRTLAAAQTVSKYIGEQAIVRDVSLEVREAEIVLLTGENGSGKSTVMRLLAGVEEPSGGTVELFSHNMAVMAGKDRAQLIAGRAGVGFQAPNLDTGFSVWDNLVMLSEARGQDINYGRAALLLERFKLANRVDDRAAVLSGGQKQRLALARIMLSGPDLLFLDEPTAPVDHAGKVDLFHDLATACRDVGTAALIVTHDTGLARPLADREYMMRSGQIIGEYVLPRDISQLAQMEQEAASGLQPA